MAKRKAARGTRKAARKTARAGSRSSGRKTVEVREDSPTHRRPPRRQKRSTPGSSVPSGGEGQAGPEVDQAVGCQETDAAGRRQSRQDLEKGYTAGRPQKTSGQSTQRPAGTRSRRRGCGATAKGPVAESRTPNDRG